MKGYKSEDLKDEDVLFEFEDKMEEVSCLDQSIMELCGELIKFNDSTGAYSAMLQQTLIPFYQEILGRSSQFSQMEIIYALCFFADLIEFGNEKFLNEFAPWSIGMGLSKLQQYPEDLDFIQTLAFFMGTAAYMIPAGTHTQLIQTIMTSLYQFLQAPFLQSEEAKVCMDNVFAAFVKLFLKHWKQLCSTEEQICETLKAVKTRLPLTNDKVESQTMNHIFVGELSVNNEFLLGTPARSSITSEMVAQIKAAMIANGPGEITDAHTESYLASLN